MKTKYILISFVLVLTSLYLPGCSSSGGNDIQTEDPNRAFEIAKRKYDSRDYLSAIEDFSFIKIKFPGTEVSEKVEYYLAMSYYMKGEYILSGYEFRTFLKDYPLSPLFPDAKYGLGLTYYRLSPKYQLDQEYTKYAISELQSFVELFPDNKNKADAGNKLKELTDKLAYKDLKTGELYMKMDDYKSASIYFRNVYETYIESDWAPDSMLGHAEALISSKKYDEAVKVLDKFYKLPKSKQSKLRGKADSLMSLAKNG